MSDPIEEFVGVTACPDCGCLTNITLGRCPECSRFHHDLVDREPPKENSHQEIGEEKPKTIDPSFYSMNPAIDIPDEEEPEEDYPDPTKGWDLATTDFTLPEE